MATAEASKIFVKVSPVPIPCPFFRPARADSVYQVCGFCTGVRGSVPMIPTIEECAKWCCTANYAACPVYRARRAEERAADRLQEQDAREAIHG